MVFCHSNRNITETDLVKMAFWVGAVASKLCESGWCVVKGSEYKDEIQCVIFLITVIKYLSGSNLGFVCGLW